MSNEEAQRILDDIDNNARGLTDWEIDFVDSMLRKTDQGYEPTPKEAQIINTIKRKVR